MTRPAGLPLPPAPRSRAASSTTTSTPRRTKACATLAPAIPARHAAITPRRPACLRQPVGAALVEAGFRLLEVPLPERGAPLTNQFDFKRVEYDIEQSAQKIFDADLALNFGKRLFLGV